MKNQKKECDVANDVKKFTPNILGCQSIWESQENSLNFGSGYFFKGFVSGKLP